MDNITLQRIQTAHPKIKDELSKIYDEINLVLSGRVICRFAYVIRTFKEQNDLFAKGRTKLFDAKGNRLGIVTNAQGGKSYHNYGLAVDIALLLDKDNNGTNESASWDNNIDFDKDGKADWMEVVAIFKKYGWEWGGDWKGKINDTPHFQKTLGLSVSQLLQKYNTKKIIVNGIEYPEL